MDKIKRSDKRKRCGNCLRIYRKGERQNRVSGASMLRFPTQCDDCKPKFLDRGNGNELKLI